MLDERWIETNKLDPPPLAKEEEPEVVARALNGDRAAVDRLLGYHVRHVLRTVRPLPRDSRDATLELVHVALAALWEALPSWDSERARLWTFARKSYVLPALREALGQRTTVPLSPDVYADHIRFRQVLRDLDNQGVGRTVAHLRRDQRLQGWSTARVQAHWGLLGEPKSWDPPTREDGTPDRWEGDRDDPLGEEERHASETFPTPDDSLNKKEQREAVQGALNTLTDRQARVLRWSFGIANGRPEPEHLTTREQAARLQVSSRRVRQLRTEALATLRALPEDQRDELREHWEAAL